MSLKDKIKTDLKASMKCQDKVSLAVLRMLNSDIRNKEIELIREINDDETLKIIKSSVKKRKDSIEMYRQGKREDLVKQEEAELNVLQKYLPTEMSEDSIRIIVREIIEKMNMRSPADFGSLMKEVMKETRGRADGKAVSAILKHELEKTE